MKKEVLLRKASKFDYWFYSYDLGDGSKIEATDPKYRTMHYAQIDHILQPAIKLLGRKDLSGLKILDCGCNSGFFSFECAKRGADYILGLEGKKEFVNQAKLLKEYFNFTNIKFKKMDVQKISVDKVGQFDIVLLMGIIYYLEDPISFMKEISRIAKKDIIIDSEVSFFDTTLFRMIFSSDHPFKFCGLTKARLVPSVGAIKALLYLSGFRSFYILNTEKMGPDYVNGRLALVASKEERQGFELLKNKPFHTTGGLIKISHPTSVFTNTKT